MSYGLLLLAAALTCASARFTVPVPIHYEIESQFQKQSGNAKMRWDPTNYLTYLAAVYSQCSHLYVGVSLQRGRVANSTAYTNLQMYFDPSLLQNNLAVYTWDVTSDASQDSGTVDRDIRKIFGKGQGSGALANVAGVDASLRNYDRFGCSVETTCKQGQQNVMTLVCIFGQTVTPRLVAGTGGQTQPPVRPTAAQRATTTRPRVRTTVAPRQATAGFYETYRDSSADLYDMILPESGLDSMQPLADDIIANEQKVTALGLCKYENNPASFSSSLLTRAFGSDAQALIFVATPDTMPTAADMAAPLTDVARNAFQSAATQMISATANPASSIACSWAICSKNFVVGCAVWGSLDSGAEEEER